MTLLFLDYKIINFLETTNQSFIFTTSYLSKMPENNHMIVFKSFDSILLLVIK